MATVFLDTNVFLYAAGRPHPLRAPCRRILQRVAAGDLAANTSSEVIQELLYVLTRRGMRSEAVHLARTVRALFPALLPVSGREIAAALELVEANPDLPARDAVHAATMRMHGLDVIVSADRHFDLLEKVERVDPGGLPLV